MPVLMSHRSATPLRYTCCAAATLLTLAMSGGTQVSAQDNYIVGPRALGMGGTGVSSTDDQTAQYYNPAMFGFFGNPHTDSDNQDLARKHWGFGLDASAGARVHGNLLELAKTISDVNITSLNNNGIQNSGDIRRIVDAARALEQIDNPGNAVTGDGSAGVSVRIGHMALGVRAFAQAASLVSNVDLINVGVQVAGPALANQIASTGAQSDGQVAAFSTAQRDQLYASLGGGGAFNPSSNAGQAVQMIDYQVRQAGFNSTQVSQAFTVLNNVATATGANNINNNSTALRVRGFGLAELPLSYGHALNEHVSFGGSLKAMVGRVYGAQVSVFDEDAPLKLRKMGDNYHQSLNWGVDLGVAARMKYVQAGLVARNLNSPKFDGFTDANGQTVDSVRVKPQAAVGFSFIPWTWLTIAADADLNPAETSFTGYQTQRIGTGIEINPWRVLALRGGIYQNMAEDDLGPVFTVGAGINLWAVRIDLAIAASTHLTPIMDHNLPDEMRASLGIMADF